MSELETIETDAGVSRARPLSWGDAREVRSQDRSFSTIYFDNDARLR